MVQQTTCTQCGQPKPPLLTQRQLEVARQLIAHPDAPNAELAKRLCISTPTLRAHLRHMYRRLEVHSRLGFVIACHTRGIVEVSQQTRTDDRKKA